MATKITVRNNGPLVIECADATLVDQNGNAFGLGGRAVIGLCRCGLSQNKPFCDGTHNREGFQSPIEARDLPPPAPKA